MLREGPSLQRLGDGVLLPRRDNPVRAIVLRQGHRMRRSRHLVLRLPLGGDTLRLDPEHPPVLSGGGGLLVGVPAGVELHAGHDVHRYQHYDHVLIDDQYDCSDDVIVDLHLNLHLNVHIDVDLDVHIDVDLHDVHDCPLRLYWPRLVL
jgi:hypothetical protein